MTIVKGNYGAKIQKRADGDFDLYLLYNMKTERHGDVWSRKTYARETTANKRISEYFKMQGVA